jgi:hypothetical protein
MRNQYEIINFYMENSTLDLRTLNIDQLAEARYVCAIIKKTEFPKVVVAFHEELTNIAKEFFPSIEIQIEKID